MTQRRTQRERGTVAVVVAMSATMIFALCALGVDLGSAFARKRDIQTQADLATLAAAAQLPYSATTESAIELAATNYATSNEVAGQDTTTWNFGDVDPANGYIEYVGANKLRLFAPQSSVDFWLAPVAGLPDGMTVSAVAAAEIFTPGRALPFFVAQQCRWGAQTILDPPRGRDTADPGYVPTQLTPPASLNPSSTDTSDIELLSVSPNSYVAPATEPDTVLISADGNKSMEDVTAVTFGTEPDALGGRRDRESTTVTVLDGSGGAQKTQVVADVPDDVLSSTNTQWWIRVLDDGAWSEVALRFTVGTPTTTATPSNCQGSRSGNFGSLELSRKTGTPSDRLPENMRVGIDHVIDSYPIASPPSPCAGDTTNAVMDNQGTPVRPVEGRVLNCLVTDPGSDLAAAATQAFITGTGSGKPGRLNVNTSTNCGPGGSSARRSVSTSGNPSSWQINDDVLSCFFKNDSVTVAAVSQASGAPTDVIDARIFDSPRFFWIPVLVDDPSSGRSGSWAVVGMQPVFITEQPDTATRVNKTATASNGVEMDSNGIAKIRIRSINPISLPPFTGDDGNTIPYLGFGTKVVRLVE